MTRIEALEELVRAALRMRRKMKDLHPVVANLSVSREEVKRFDEMVAKLTKEIQDGKAK